LGTASLPGATDSNATVDSREQFYSAIFAGYGIACVRAARKSPIRANDVRLLAGVMLAGGVRRLVSLVRNGRPHWFQDVLTTIEFAVPAVLFGLADAHEKAGLRARMALADRCARIRPARVNRSCDGIPGGSRSARACAAV
jgi:hypothetical protein